MVFSVIKEQAELEHDLCALAAVIYERTAMSTQISCAKRGFPVQLPPFLMCMFALPLLAQE